MGLSLHRELLIYFLMKHPEGLTIDEMIKKAHQQGWKYESKHVREYLTDHVEQLSGKNSPLIKTDQDHYKLQLFEKYTLPCPVNAIFDGGLLTQDYVIFINNFLAKMPQEQIDAYKSSKDISFGIHVRLAATIEIFTGKSFYDIAMWCYKSFANGSLPKPLKRGEIQTEDHIDQENELILKLNEKKVKK